MACHSLERTRQTLCVCLRIQNATNQRHDEDDDDDDNTACLAFHFLLFFVFRELTGDLAVLAGKLIQNAHQFLQRRTDDDPDDLEDVSDPGRHWFYTRSKYIFECERTFA